MSQGESNMQKAQETEYNALRAEILKRIELRNQIVLGSLTLAGLALSLGANVPTIALVYPLISVFLAAAWVQNDLAIKRIGKYIREQLEPKVDGLNWQTYLHTAAESMTSVMGLRFNILAAGGVFLVTQLVSLLVGPLKVTAFSIVDWALGVIAILCSVVTVLLIHRAAKHGQSFNK